MSTERRKLNELDSPFERKRFILYAKDGSSVVYRTRLAQLITGNLYRGEDDPDQYGNTYCDLFVWYPEAELGIKIGNVNPFTWFVDDLVASADMQAYLTSEDFQNRVRSSVDQNTHFPNIEIELMKYLDISLVEPMAASKRRFSEEREQIRAEKKRREEAEERAYVEDRNREADKIVTDAIDTLYDGGILENSRITFYKSRYDSSTYSVINHLMREYGINVPLRTQGWINEKLISAKIEYDGSCKNVRYLRAKNGKCSEKIFGYMTQLAEAVRTGFDGGGTNDTF